MSMILQVLISHGHKTYSPEQIEYWMDEPKWYQ